MRLAYSWAARAVPPCGLAGGREFTCVACSQPTAAAVISSTQFVVGGGGGKAKTGVPNRITLIGDGKPDLQVCSPTDRACRAGNIAPCRDGLVPGHLLSCADALGSVCVFALSE